jgi:MerR family mercuric resistance operon transcriptional regulator
MQRTISKVAKELDINVETVRFYERKNLIQQPKKPVQGYRHYPDETLNRIRFIKRAQELGFTLEEIANLLTLNDKPCKTVQQLAEQKLGAVQKKIADLNLLSNSLQSLLSQFESNDDDAHCPIIDSFEP